MKNVSEIFGKEISQVELKVNRMKKKKFSNGKSDDFSKTW